MPKNEIIPPKPAPAIRTRENRGKRDTAGRPQPVTFHGRSFLSVIEQEHPEGFDEIYASHTFHEITMYYPMRVVLSGRFKYIFNIAHQLPYPFASDLYASPRRLRGWDERPTRGEYLEEARVWSHEVDFWGGDLDSLRARLDHIDAMGADVVYLE